MGFAFVEVASLGWTGRAGTINQLNFGKGVGRAKLANLTRTAVTSFLMRLSRAKDEDSRISIPITTAPVKPSASPIILLRK